MSLSAGSRLGPYEIVAPLGAGGMGEVYRARDTQLKREVAIKVLPEAFAQDPDRLARFQPDIWVYEWARDTLTRLTFDPAEDRKPVWTPDGRRIVFASARGDKSTYNLHWQRADGTGDAQRLTESKNPQFPASWHPSGTFLAFEETHPQTSNDLMILPMEGDEASGWTPGKPTVFLNTPFAEREPMFSPDGRWLAYVSNETGRNEVYVRPFPGPGGKWQISTGGGNYPTWSRAKHELFYGTANQQIMVAAFTVESGSFRAEKPRLCPRGVSSGAEPTDRSTCTPTGSGSRSRPLRRRKPARSRTTSRSSSTSSTSCGASCQ